MSNSYSYDSLREPNVRASDGDREHVADTLRNHHAEGRLDNEEMQQRIDACYDAKTVGDLEALLHDLPRQDPGDQAQLGYSNRFPYRLGSGRRPIIRLWPILIALIALSIVTGHHLFWVAIPLFFLTTRSLAPLFGQRRTRAGDHWE
jgi:hypothetical protein